MTTQIQVLTTTVVDKLHFISSLCHFHTKTGPHAQHLPHPHACMSEWLHIHNKAGTTAVYWKWKHTNPLPLSVTYLSHVGRTVDDSSFILYSLATVVAPSSYHVHVCTLSNLFYFTTLFFSNIPFLPSEIFKYYNHFHMHFYNYLT